MYLIEPCCAKKHLLVLRDAIGRNGMTLFEGYGDLSLTELLPALLTRYSETAMLIAAPSLPDQAADILKKWLKKQWARMDGRGKLNVISRLTVIADLSEDASPEASSWKKKELFAGRLCLCDLRQSETAILLPDFAIVGPVNMQYGNHFVATATSKPSHIADLWDRFQKKAASNDPGEKQETSTAPESQEGGDESNQTTS